MIGKKIAASILVEVIDWPAKRRLVSSIFVDSGNFGLQLAKELLCKAILDKDVIRSDTQLATVDEAHRCNFRGCVIHVSCLVDDDGTFTAELKHTRCQILSSCLSDKFTRSCASCENDKVNRC